MAKKQRVKAQPPSDVQTILRNKRVRHDYDILREVEAGMVLTGTEIKSIRAGNVNLRDGFVLIRNGEAWLMNVHIAPYEHGNRSNHDETRPRKLLLHRRQIDQLYGAVTQRNWTIVPLRLYINDRGLAKTTIALVHSKRQHDKRADIARRDAKRDIERALKQIY